MILWYPPLLMEKGLMDLLALILNFLLCHPNDDFLRVHQDMQPLEQV